MTGPVMAYLGQDKLELGPAAGVAAKRGWRFARGSDGIAWLALDKAESDTNTVSEEVIRALADLLTPLEEDPPRALVLRSAKPAGFAAGADIDEIARLDADGATELLREAHGVLDRLEALSCPTIAVVHGAALGAGFELALACDRRIAIDGASFGFPEVQLGLHPGLGGTFRLTGLIEPTEAMTLMLTGKSAHTAKARDLGIADAVIEERHVVNAVAEMARQGAAPESRGLVAQAFRARPARSLAARQMRSRTEEKAPQRHYPAPHALIDLWEEHGTDRDAMQAAEIESFARLLGTETCANLIRVFGLRRSLKRSGDGESGIAHVHVIGAGAMGGDIAAWAALKGKTVTLEDVELAPIAAAIPEARRICEDEHLDAIETRDALDRLIPDPGGAGRRRADLVIEAVPEDRELKGTLYGELSDMKSGAILATNTSSLRLSGLSGEVPDPARFAGLHFFNPVAKMNCVEVVRHDGADDTVLARLQAFCGEIDRLPVAVTDYPGFLVNRALTPYLMEALALLDGGIDKRRIDGAALAFGMPMGPVTLADQVGLDICLDVAESLRADLDKPFAEIPGWLSEKVEAGETGKKAGQGLYDWSNGAPSPGPQPDDALADRLLLPMLDACVECLRLGVAPDADTIDGAMIFATGFAPFRGGPLHYARARGVDEVVARLEELRDRHGDRFAPDDGWQRLA